MKKSFNSRVANLRAIYFKIFKNKNKDHSHNVSLLNRPAAGRSGESKSPIFLGFYVTQSLGTKTSRPKATYEKDLLNEWTIQREGPSHKSADSQQSAITTILQIRERQRKLSTWIYAA